MRVIDRINLIDDIAKKLEPFEGQRVFRFLDAFEAPKILLREGQKCGIIEYITVRLGGVKDPVLKKMAENLDIDISHLAPPSAKSKTTPVKKEIDSSPMIGFISYEHTDVDYANRLSKILAEYNIAAFVAYRNTREGEEFQPDIIAALNKMTFFISIHTEAFSASPYCQQEVGFALAKDVKMIQIKLGKDPDGFIKGITAIVQNAQNLDIITPRILKMLADSPKTKELYSVKVASKVDIEDRMKGFDKAITAQKQFRNLEYITEADVLNIAIFGCTEIEWQEDYPELHEAGEKLRDSATITDLHVIMVAEKKNAEMVRDGWDRKIRFIELQKVAKRELRKLNNVGSINRNPDEIYFI